MKNKSFEETILKLYFKGYNLGGKVNQLLYIIC